MFDPIEYSELLSVSSSEMTSFIITFWRCSGTRRLVLSGEGNGAIRRVRELL